MNYSFSKLRINFFCRRCGMTLIELLVVLSIVSLLGTAIYHALSNGMKVWEKSHRIVIEEDVVIFFDWIRHDLYNSMAFSQIPFEGDSRHLSFPTMIHAAEQGEVIGKVEYVYDGAAQKIIRRQADYGQAMNQVYGVNRDMVFPVERMSFRYVYLTGDGELMAEQILETIPAGIEIDVVLSDEAGQRQMTRVINLPIGI